MSRPLAPPHRLLAAVVLLSASACASEEIRLPPVDGDELPAPTCDLLVDEQDLEWKDDSVCESPREVALLNRGDAPCSVTLEIEGAGFGIERQQVEVAPKAAEHVALWRRADSPGAATATLHVSGPELNASVALRAAAEFGLITDRFQIDPPPRVDYLVVVDDSPAMAAHTGPLQAWAAETASLLLEEGIDFRWGVTTTSRVATEGCAGSGADGRLLPLDAAERWFGPQTPDAAEAIGRSLDVGTCSAAPNEGFAAAWRALSELDGLQDDPAHPEPADGHAGFLRRGADAAHLRLIFVSTQDNQSEGGVGEWMDRFLSVHGVRNSNLLAIDAIVPGQAGCGGAPAATRYRELAGLLGGAADLCEPESWETLLAPSIGKLASWSFPQRFHLNDLPVDVNGDGALEDDIVVRVGGETFLPDGRWSYVLPINSIAFEPMFQPGPGSVIEVVYTPSCSL